MSKPNEKDTPVKRTPQPMGAVTEAAGVAHIKEGVTRIQEPAINMEDISKTSILKIFNDNY